MKLSQIDYSTKEAKEFELLDPITNLPFETPVKISLYFHDSRHGKRTLAEAQLEVLEYMQKNNVQEVPESVLEEINIKRLSKLIAGWSGIEDEKGKPLKYNEKNALLVLENDIIFNFVTEKASNLGNFLKE